MIFNKFASVFSLVVALLAIGATAHRGGVLRQGVIESKTSFTELPKDYNYLDDAFTHKLNLVLCPESLVFEDEWPVGRMVKVTGTSWEENKTLSVTLYPREDANNTSPVNPIFQFNVKPISVNGTKTFECERVGYEGEKMLNTTEGACPFVKSDEGFMLVMVRAPHGFQLDAYAYNSTSEHKWTGASYPVFPVNVTEKPAILKTFSTSDIRNLKFYVSDDVKTVQGNECMDLPTTTPNVDTPDDTPFTDIFDLPAV